MIPVFIIASITADGLIARDASHAATWSSPADKKFFVSRTKAAGAIIMGAKTFATIGRPLPGRLNVVYTHQPTPHPEVMATALPPAELLAELEGHGVTEAAICGGSSIYTLFLKAGLVQKIYLTVEPRLFGQGLSLFNQELDLTLKLLSTQQLAPDVVLLEYQVIT
jgi:dihydrofolate reductase